MTMPELDLSTCEDWNLRALLLRLADRDDVLDGSCTAEQLATDADARAMVLGLVDEYWLTPLGSKLAEALRPVPWRVEDHVAGWVAVVHESAKGTIICESSKDAAHIAVLCSANDDRNAKQYRSAP